jgi:hypothetical protein
MVVVVLFVVVLLVVVVLPVVVVVVVLKVRLTSFTFLSSGMRLRQIIVG